MMPPFMKGFMLGPNMMAFPIKMPRGKSNESRPICSIYNGKFLICLSENMEFEDYSKLLLECRYNPDYKGPENSVTLFDAYEYLQNTHFLGFVVSKVFHREIWWTETIDMQLQLVDGKNSSYAKIMIMIETNRCPEVLFELTSSDRDQSKYIGLNNSIGGIPLMEKVLISKSMHSPVVIYDISLGFNDHSKVNFNNIHLGNLYDLVISKYIEDAVDIFYPKRKYIDQINERNLNEKLIRVTFEVVTENNLMSIKLICTPAVYFSEGSEDLYKYHFAGNDRHLISLEPINQRLPLSNADDFCSFLDSVSSSNSSQIMTLYTADLGDVHKGYEAFNASKSHDVIITPHRAISNIDRFKVDKDINCGKKRYFPQFEIKSSDYDAIINYWCPMEDVIISVVPDNSHRIKIRGFINFDSNKLGDKTFHDVYQIIQHEFNHRFSLTRDDYEYEKFNCACCYRSKNIVRLVLTSNVDSSINEDRAIPIPQKKKFKMFGGK